MLQRLPKQGGVGTAAASKCPVSTIIWILAAWVLLFQVYTTLYPPPTALTHPKNRVRSIIRYTEYEEPEFNRLPLPPNRNGKKRRPDYIEEFWSSSHKRQIYFPNKSSAIDPLTNNEDDRFYFHPGREWHDSQGRPIQAHGGGILYIPETRTFYWYGENKDGRTYHISKHSTARVDVIGINCYSSTDLWLWKNEGIVLKADERNVSSDLHVSKVVERPKVIYNDKTRKYVMWMHIDNANYSKASVGVAVSLKPEGPFKYLGSAQPHGFDSRDMTVFKDGDGTAYIIYSSEGNSELHVTVLAEDYLGFRNIMSRVLVHGYREAPAVFKHRGLYYMITSGCTGWAPNTALVHSAESMLGSWQLMGNPCVGGNEELRDTTFFSQGTFVLPLPGIPDMFIFMADRWNPYDLRDSRYVWLPLTMDGPADEPLEDVFEFPLWSRVSIHWYQKWKLPQDWDKVQI
ncbi:hypothetical protein O6H91_14G043000 [Diphasiastrum complanatum]|uniref:Uncharacterized protein n=3 Tax=Diphasiastrum complanatum TaxID=34168 RepID=A0ACC2BNQ9_DIPCM|nr:hypothetical protein O6H91_14G043000 [Diphasiastrum complanatum]KAJ7531417.1 hypothetical protein O6H91_14G043000 [Diphasiastrum complanatum]KAJ7531418.1 hypothetical protein O6H91_14G043000 [Diphasiastrum complanatum]